MRKTPYIEEVPFSREGLDGFVANLEMRESADQAPDARYLLRYPTVYVINHEDNEKFSVYVGETTDIRQRTVQHLDFDPKHRDDWRAISDATKADMYVIGHELFNKSLTLDIENRLMLYLSGIEHVAELYNRRSNAQRDYYTQEECDRIFSSIWRGLRKRNKKLFPTEQIVRDSALFKASPFHKLSDEQLEAKRQIYNLINEALESDETGQLILVSGEAGAGKTVLLSSLFYELFQGESTDDEPFEFKDRDAYLFVNHDEQLTVYRQIASKLGLLKNGENRVSRPTTFIMNNDPDSKVDVILVDEAHLLWTQGKQSYRGKNQLEDLLDRSRVVVAVFDPNQIMATNQFWEEDRVRWLESRTTKRVVLENQMRIDASPETVTWIRNIVDNRTVGKLPPDETGYDLRVFDDASEMHRAITDHASSVEKGLSRLIATFDWSYSSTSSPTDDATWKVKAGTLELPWNGELKKTLSRAVKRSNNGKAWAEQSQTINEVGSTFTIQGFDLNYAGVIIGPSVKYRGGRVIFDPAASANKGATQRRTLADGTKVRVGEELIKNELNVLLTRGVHGLYIYAVDDELREALKGAVTGG